MSFLRPLSETILDLADGALGPAGGATARVRSIEMSVPIDIALDDVDGFRGDFPLFRRRTAFDPAPARLHLVLAEDAP